MNNEVIKTRAVVEDLKEDAPCGMRIHYTVDKSTDMVIYDDINGRGKECEQCRECTWRGICQPLYQDNLHRNLETLKNKINQVSKENVCATVENIYLDYGAGIMGDTIIITKRRDGREPFRFQILTPRDLNEMEKFKIRTEREEEILETYKA